MSHFQIALEKTCLQKCLLFYEGLHGRPSTRQERTLMKPFYDRYRVVKQLQNSSSASSVITTIRRAQMRRARNLLSHTHCLTQSNLTPSLQTSLSWSCVKLHWPELLDHLRMARTEKRRLHHVLREFEEHFYSQTGRACQKEDRGPMAEEYCQYKNLKAKLRLLEALLSKHQGSTSS
uniref:FAM13A-like domain-containing protein n=1 Tax=Periophthalmus magnuspinnatus TaxID=409849 RepID=A0A3B3Z692_9GOBI